MIYLDACLVICLVENHTVFAPRIKQRILQAAPAEFAISPLVIARSFSDALSPKQHPVN